MGLIMPLPTDRIPTETVPLPTYVGVMTRRSRKCPRCGETGIPIVYGSPPYELFQASEQGLLVLGGCEIEGDDPTWWCDSDQYGWASVGSAS